MIARCCRECLGIFELMYDHIVVMCYLNICILYVETDGDLRVESEVTHFNISHSSQKHVCYRSCAFLAN